MRPKSMTSNLLRSLAWTTALGVAAIVGSSLAFETLSADEAPPAGVRGIFRAESPQGLILEDFETLPESWTPWGEATADDIAQLYEGDLDAAGQRAQIAKLKDRVDTMQEALGDPRYRAIHPHLTTLSRRLVRRIDLAEAILDTLDAPGADAGLRGKLTELVAALEDYEASNNQAAGAAVRRLVSEIETLAPDGGERIMQVLLVHYLNYNVRVVVGEEFFRSYVSECRLENKPVRDCFMGTNIFGRSSTSSQVDFNLVPNPYAAEFAINVQGNVQSSTTGYNPKATLFTRGNHFFRASKRIRFDGERLSSSPAFMEVDANNHTYGARTKYSNLPLIGKFADKVAVKEARKRRPQSEAHARMRVREEAEPRFNSEVDNQLGETNHDLQHDINPRLRAKGLYPEAYNYATTSSSFIANYRVVDPGELSAGAPISIPLPSNGLTARLHEGYVNNLLDRIGLHGQRLTETELRERLEAFFSELTGRDVDVDPPEEEDGVKFIFAEEDPIRVRFENGGMQVTLRTGLERPGEEDIDVQEITVPLDYALDGRHIQVTRGTVRVSARGGVATAAVLRSRIQKSIPESRTRDGWVDIEKDDGTIMPLYITTLEMVDGWLVLALEK